MAIPRSPGGGSPAKKPTRTRKPKPKPYSPPATTQHDSRTADAGRKVVKKYNTTTSHDSRTADAGRKEARTYRKLEAQRERIKAAKPPGDDHSPDERRRARKFFGSDQHFEDQKAAAKARYERAKRRGDKAEADRLFGDPRKDSQRADVIRKYDRDTLRTGRIRRSKIGRELGPQGTAARELSKLADKLAPKSGGGAGFAFANPGAQVHPNLDSAKFGKAFVRDIVNLPGQAVPSAVETSKAGLAATKGNTKPAKKLFEDFKQTDPIYNTAAAIKEAATGDLKSAKSHLKKAGKTASEHPGLTALEIYGGAGGLSRGAGAGLRQGGKATEKAGKKIGNEKVERAGKRAHDYASTERDSKKLEGTSLQVRREYSRNLAKKRAQVRSEKTGRKKAAKLREEARQARERGEVVAAQELHAKANKKDPDRVSDAEISRRVTEEQAASDVVRRVNRSETVKAADRAAGGRRGRAKHGAALTLRTQNVIRADKEDILAYIRELSDEYDKGGLTESEKRANEKLRKQLADITRTHSKDDYAELDRLAEDYAESQRGAQRRLEELGILDEEQGPKAREMPWAVRNLNARVETVKGRPVRRMTSEHVQAMIAGEHRRVATKKVDTTATQKARADRNFEAAKANARVSAARTKTSNTLKTREWRSRKARAKTVATHRAVKVAAGRVQTAASIRARQAEQTYLRSDSEYVRLHNAYKAAKREHTAAAKEAQSLRKAGQKRAETERLLTAGLELRATETALRGRREELLAKPAVANGKITARGKVKQAERKAVAAKAKATPSKLIQRERRSEKAADANVRQEQRRIRGVELAAKPATKRGRKSRPSPVDVFLRADEAKTKATVAHERARTELLGEKTAGPKTETGKAPAPAGGRELAHQEAKAKASGKRKYQIPGLVDPTGRALDALTIRHIRRQGEEDAVTGKVTREPELLDPAYVSHAPRRGSSDYYVPPGPAQIGTKHRTGRAVKTGMDAHPDRLVEQAARSQGLIDAQDAWTEFTDQVAYRVDGKLPELTTREDADRFIRNMPDGSREWVVVRLNPLRGNAEQLQVLLDRIDSNVQDASKNFEEIFKDALKPGPGPGEYAIIPKQAADTMREHLSVFGHGDWAQAWQKASQLFRTSVLSTSPTWFAGNVIEATLRSVIGGAGFRSWADGRRVLKAMEDDEVLGANNKRGAKKAHAQIVGGGHGAMQLRAVARRDASQFSESTKAGRLAHRLGNAFQKPGLKQGAEAWQAYTHLVFDQVNRRIENNFQTAMFGKELRRAGMFDKGFLRTSDQAIKDAAAGLRGTDAQVALGRKVDRMYGQYGKWSPGMRKAIAYYTPFIAWTYNALRFIFDVLPRDHPVLTSALAANAQLQQEWLKDKGLVSWAEGAMPAFLQGSVPGKNGEHWRVGRYTPFGFFSDPLGTVAGLWTPQGSSVLKAFQGEDWKGDDLKPIQSESGKTDTIDQALYAGWSIFNSMVPAVAIGVRVKRTVDQAKESDGTGDLAARFFGVKVPKPGNPGRKKTKKTTDGFSSGGFSGGFSEGSFAP